MITEYMYRNIIFSAEQDGIIGTSACCTVFVLLPIEIRQLEVPAPCPES